MSECSKHERDRRQGSPCPYCRIAELDTENKRLKNRGTITSPMDGLFEENERLEAKLDAVIKLKRFDIDSDDGKREYISNGDFLDAWDVYLALKGEAK